MKPIKLILISFFLLAINACKHDDLEVYQENKNYRNAADFVKNNYDLSLFYAALQQADLVETLKGEGPFTLFAPNDAAFNDLGITKPADFAKMNKDSLKLLMKYHVLPRRLYLDDVPKGTVDNRYDNLAGKRSYLALFSRNGTSRMYVNGAMAGPVDVVLANGVLQVLNKVIKYREGTVADVLTNRPQYSIFVAGLKHFGYWEQLKEKGPWTVLAPDNDAFAAANITLETIKAMKPEEYKKRLFGVYIFRNHFFKSDFAVMGEKGSGYYSNSGAHLRVPVQGDEEFCSGVGSNELVFVANTFPLEESTPKRITTFGEGYKLDDMSDNGMVHNIKTLLVLPQEAKK